MNAPQNVGSAYNQGHGFGGQQQAQAVGSFQPGTAGTATSVVELSIAAKNLRDMDVFSKSDPMCVVYLQPFGSKRWQEVARTEIIRNNLNPEFTTKVKLNYLFEEQQHIKFQVRGSKKNYCFVVFLFGKQEKQTSSGKS